jgi:hypothetical protein
MPNKHTPRRNKSTDLLLTKEDPVVSEYYVPDDLNVVGSMSHDAKLEAVTVISDRIYSAKDQTQKMRKKMADQDKQYKGIWKDNSNAEDIFLPKTREEVNALKAYLISVITQLYPIVKMEPYGTSSVMSKFKDDYRRAKLNEAMFTFYWYDIWHANDDILPRFLNHFLKYPMGLMKVDYYETETDPDLRLLVKDRAFMYLDPRANTFYEQGWIGEQWFAARTEVLERVDRGDWVLSDKDYSMLSSGDITTYNNANLERYFGKSVNVSSHIHEDEFVQVFEYLQFPRMGLGDVYAVTLGGTEDDPSNGILVRYGENPAPFKGNPYISAVFNQDDRPDGESLCDFQEPFQRVLNTFYDLREKDVRKNIRQSKAVLEQMVDQQTEDDWDEGKSLVRLSEAFGEQVMTDPNLDLRKYVVDLGGGTTTGELYRDIDFILNQGQKSASLPDVFRGLNAQPGATLGQVQEQITRASGQHLPTIRQLMRAIERTAEVSTAFFKSEEFFSNERVIRIVGRGNFEGVIEERDEVSENSLYKSVSADDLDVDLIFNAVSAADAIMAKTLLSTVIERILASVGQNPRLMQILEEEINFASMFKSLVNVTGMDTENFILTDAQKEARRKQQEADRERAKQEQIQMQQIALQMDQLKKQSDAKIDALLEEIKQGAMAKKQVTVDTSRNMQDLEKQTTILDKEYNLKLRNEIRKVLAEFQAEGNLLRLKTDEDKELMDHEASLEKQAIQQGKTVSVGTEEKNVQLNQGDSSQ